MKILQFYGINFLDTNYKYIKKILIKKKGYIVMPAASALVEIEKNYLYKNSLKKSTVAIFDSGFFCILLLVCKFLFFKKFSGFKFLNFFLNDKFFKDKKVLSLDPTIKDAKKNNRYFKFMKFKFVRNYICPIYDCKNVKDRNLLTLINKYKPYIVIINIAGGIQEPLALYIKNNSIHNLISICSGAAISYLNGSGAKINKWIDNLYLGWLVRICHDPRIIKRIVMSIYLIKLVIYCRPMVFRK